MRCVVYIGRWFASALGVVRGSPLAMRPLWLPAYVLSAPRLPDAWDACTFWQNSGDGSPRDVPGVRGVFDHDVFMGSLGELRAFCLASVIAPPTTGAPAGADAVLEAAASLAQKGDEASSSS